MPLIAYHCLKCNLEFEVLFKTFKEADSKSRFASCPTCGKQTKKDDIMLPAKFMGYFGPNATAPSKRHTTKLMDKKGNI